MRLVRRLVRLVTAAVTLSACVLVLTARPAAAEYTFGETVLVDAVVGAAYSVHELTAGQAYLLEVRGTYAAGGSAADAECATGGVDPTWHPERGPDSVFELLVGGYDLAWAAYEPDWAGCDRNHRYVAQFTPVVDGPLELRLAMPASEDPVSGVLEVLLNGDDSAPEPAPEEEGPPPPPEEQPAPAPSAEPEPQPEPETGRPATAEESTPPPARTTPQPAPPAATPPRPVGRRETPGAGAEQSNVIATPATTGAGDEPPAPPTTVEGPPEEGEIHLATPAAQTAGGNGPVPDRLIVLSLSAVVLAAAGATAVRGGLPHRVAVSSAGHRQATISRPTPTLLIVDDLSSSRVRSAGKACDCGYCKR